MLKTAISLFVIAQRLKKVWSGRPGSNRDVQLGNFVDQSLHPPRHRPVSLHLLERLYRLSWSDPAALRSAPPRKGAGNGLCHRPSLTKPKYRLPNRNIMLNGEGVRKA